MEKTKKTPLLQKVKNLSLPAKWAIGYLGVPIIATLLVYFWRVIFFTTQTPPALPLTLGVAGVFTVLYLALFCICYFAKDNFSLKAALCVFMLGLVFCFVSAPLQAPDEQLHFLRAYSISEGHFNFDGTREYPDDVALFVEHFPGFYNHQVTYAGMPMIPNAFAAFQADISNGVSPNLSHTEPIMFMLLPFLPQALGMAVARLLGFSVLGIFYAGRITNLLVYTLLCYKAFCNCHKYRGMFIGLAILPLSLFLAASCSYDSPMLALCYLAISYFCKKEIHTRDVWVFGICVALATYIKPMNIVLVAVLLLIPKTRWKTKIHPWVAAGLILAGGIALWAFVKWFNPAVLAQGYPVELPRGSGEAPAPMAQFLFVLKNPLRFLSVVFLSIYEEAAFLFKLGVFGSTDLSIPLVSGLSVLGLCTASTLGIQQRDDTKTTGAIALFLAAGLYAGAIMAGMYVLDTDLYAIRISGVQPRYFLPAFLLLFMLASILLGKGVRPRLDGKGTVVRTEELTLWIVAALALFAAVLIFQNYFIGQWLPKLEGGWQLVNFFGRMPS